MFRQPRIRSPPKTASDDAGDARFVGAREQNAYMPSISLLHLLFIPDAHLFYDLGLASAAVLNFIPLLEACFMTKSWTPEPGPGTEQFHRRCSRAVARLIELYSQATVS